MIEFLECVVKAVEAKIVTSLKSFNIFRRNVVNPWRYAAPMFYNIIIDAFRE
jgi:hypothetical protein